MPTRTSAATARHALLLAAIGLLPTLAGPGAAVASIALLAGDHSSHRVSLQRDLGHEYLVICHDALDVSAMPALRDADECAGDHRLHVTRDDGLVARDSSKATAHPDAAALPAPPPGPQRAAVPTSAADSPAPLLLTRLQRTVVLRL